jgi:hypothetical protein
VVGLGNLQKTFNDKLGGDQGIKHASPDLTNDIESLMKSLSEYKVYKVQKGRMLRDEELAKDVIGVGLQNLLAGEKNPLAEYNAAFRRLQKRRRMKPVSLAVLQKLQQPGIPPPIPHPEPSIPAETSQTRAVISAEEAEEEPGSPVEEESSEIDQILDDLENGVFEETLPRLTEEDVALDMDEVAVEDDNIDESDESDMSEEEFEIGWVGEQREEID